MNEDKIKMLERINKLACTYDKTDNVRKLIEEMTDNEKLFLSHLLLNLTFISTGIQLHTISLGFFCKIFEIKTSSLTDREIINQVNNTILKFSKYKLCEENGYGELILCGYKTSWVTGTLTLSPNPFLEEVQKKWKKLKD